MHRYRIMKKIFLSVLIACISHIAVAQKSETPVVQDCPTISAAFMDFLIDGSFQSQKVPAQEIAKLKVCGLDDFDVEFFGNMDALNAMLRKMTQVKKIDKLTYGDLMNEIYKVKETNYYKNVRAITITGDQLAARVGNYKNWPVDEKLFDELGSSAAVKKRVLDYLRAHPDNTKTYLQILELVKK